MAGKVLVVDDEQDNVDLLERALQYAGHEVVKATSGPEALALLPEFHPDVVILDVMMSGMSGLDVLKKIKQTYAHPPAFILFTVRDDIQEITDGLKAGAFSYLVKPSTIDMLLNTVQAALDSRPQP
jgi:CheY-like chemotaxis protein